MTNELLVTKSLVVEKVYSCLTVTKQKADIILSLLYRHQKATAIGFIILVALLLVGTFLWQWADKNLNTATHRDYSFLSFNEMDATEICSSKMKQELGNSLLRSHTDSHSTRVDPKTGIYKIYMKAEIGSTATYNLYNEIMVYCYVNPRDFELSYYRVVNPNEAAFSYADIKFFGN